MPLSTCEGQVRGRLRSRFSSSTLRQPLCWAASPCLSPRCPQERWRYSAHRSAYHCIRHFFPCGFQRLILGLQGCIASVLAFRVISPDAIILILFLAWGLNPGPSLCYESVQSLCCVQSLFKPSFSIEYSIYSRHSAIWQISTIYFSFITKALPHFCVYNIFTYECTPAVEHMWRSGVTCRFGTLSTMWVLELKLRILGLAASHITNCAILVAS